MFRTTLRLTAYLYFLFYMLLYFAYLGSHLGKIFLILMRYVKTVEINWPLKQKGVFKLLIKLGALFHTTSCSVFGLQWRLTMAVIKNVFCSLQHHLPLRLPFRPRLDALQHMHFSFVYYPRVVLFPNIDIIYFYQH